MGGAAAFSYSTFSFSAFGGTSTFASQINSAGFGGYGGLCVVNIKILPNINNLTINVGVGGGGGGTGGPTFPTTSVRNGNTYNYYNGTDGLNGGNTSITYNGITYTSYGGVGGTSAKYNNTNVNYDYNNPVNGSNGSYDNNYNLGNNLDITRTGVIGGTSSYSGIAYDFSTGNNYYTTYSGRSTTYLASNSKNGFIRRGGGGIAMYDYDFFSSGYPKGYGFSGNQGYIYIKYFYD